MFSLHSDIALLLKNGSAAKLYGIILELQTGCLKIFTQKCRVINRVRVKGTVSHHSLRSLESTAALSGGLASWAETWRASLWRPFLSAWCCAVVPNPHLWNGQLQRPMPCSSCPFNENQVKVSTWLYINFTSLSITRLHWTGAFWVVFNIPFSVLSLILFKFMTSYRFFSKQVR